MSRDKTSVIKVFDLIPLSNGRRILNTTFPSDLLSPTHYRLFCHIPKSCEPRNNQIFYRQNDMIFCITQIQKQLNKNKATLIPIAVDEDTITFLVKTHFSC